MQISEKIAFLRKKKGWSQEQLSIKLQVSRQAVYKWEAGISYPEIDKIKKLASMFDISFNDFLDDEIDITKSEEPSSEVIEDKEDKPSFVVETPENGGGGKKIPPLPFIIGGIVTLVAVIALVVTLIILNNQGSTPPDPSTDLGSGEITTEDSITPPIVDDQYYTVVCMVNGSIYSADNILSGGMFKPDSIQVSGYNFEGWYDEDTLWAKEGGIVSKNLTLVAKLTPCENEIILNSNDGTKRTREISGKTDEQVSISYGWVREGYRHTGWSKTENGEIIVPVGEKYRVQAGTNVLYAVWEIEEYKINYVLDGGINSGGNPYRYTINDTVSLLSPTKAGCGFMGWYLDSSFNNKVSEISKSTGDITIYALWADNEIRYHLNGGVNSESNQTHYIEGQVTKLYNPTRDYYIFGGWYRDEGLTVPIEKIEISDTGSLDLYAKWDYVSFTVKEKDDGHYILLSVDTSIEGRFEIPREYNGMLIRNIADNAFLGCDKITSIYIPDSVLYISDLAFNGAKNVTAYEVAEDNAIFESVDGSIYNYLRNRIIKYPQGKTDEDFILPSGVMYVNNYAFYENQYLKSIDISNVYSIGRYAFSECASLQYIKAGNLLNFIDAYAFYKCKYLDSFSTGGELFSIGNFAFSECPNLRELVFEGKIGEIGWSAFKNNNKLQSVVFGSTVDKLSTNLLEGCINLRFFAVPNGVKTINKYLLKNCNNLIGVSIPDTVTLIEDGAFESCYDLEKIYLSLGVTEIQGTPFSHCGKLTIYAQTTSALRGWSATWNSNLVSGKCPVVWDCNGEGELYEGIGYMNKPDGTLIITGGNEVEHIVIPEAVGGMRVTGIIADAFKNHTTLKTVTFLGRNVSIGLDAFYGCTSIEAIYVSDIDAWLSLDFQDKEANPMHNGAELYVGRNMKYEKLTALTVPDYIEEIGDYAFCGCTSLERVDFNEKIKSLGIDCFLDCDTIKYVSIQNATEWCSVKIESLYANPMVYAEYNYVRNVKITKLDLDVDEIGDYCFAGCKQLKTITLSQYVKRIGKNAFYGCSVLESIGIPETVAYVGEGAFKDCEKLTIYYEGESAPSGWSSKWNESNCPVYYGILDSKTEYYEFSQGQITKYVGANNNLVIPSQIDGVPVTSINNGAFTNNKNIVSVTLPSTVVTIDERAFCGCDKLESVTIPEGVKIIGEGAFEDCISLKSVKIPSTAGMIYDSAFKGCKSLMTVTLVEGCTSVGKSMFENCTQLEAVNLPSTVKSISENAFLNCSSLKEITLPDGLTSIGRSAFNGCSSLAELFIPKSVATIDSFAFNNTSDTLVIKCEADIQPDGWSYYVLSDKNVLWSQTRQ